MRALHFGIVDWIMTLETPAPGQISSNFFRSLRRYVYNDINHVLLEDIDFTGMLARD